jgi:hypothetical protein
LAEDVRSHDFGGRHRAGVAVARGGFCPTVSRHGARFTAGFRSCGMPASSSASTTIWCSLIAFGLAGSPRHRLR